MGTKSISKFDRLYTKLLENLQDDDFTFYFWRVFCGPCCGGTDINKMLILAENNMTFDQLFGQSERYHRDGSEVWDDMTRWKLYQLEGGKTSPNAFINAVKNNKTFVLPETWIDFDGESTVFVSRDYDKLIKLIYNYYKIGGTMKPVFQRPIHGKPGKWDVCCGKITNKIPVFIEYLDKPGQYITNITFSNIRPYNGDNQFPTLGDIIPDFGEPPDPADDWKNNNDDE